MTDLSETEIERRTLALLEILGDYPNDPAARVRLLEGEHPAIVERVLKITKMSSRMGAMPTDLPGTAATPPLPPPERFGVYRFVTPLGRGGMGEVWRGQRDDGLFDQTVAIKLIQPHLQVRAGEAFESERRILARFEHPNIARLIDGGTTDDGRACFVMEYIDGVTFDVACEGLPLANRVVLFRHALEAVGYAHGRLVAHGDLKPSNILVDATGRARLLDFGIARLVTDEASAFMLTGAVTSSFASPARLAGEPPSIADDVFALGRLLQVAIAGDHDRDMSAIARKASATDEADRYGNVPEFLADLDRWSQRRPVVAQPRTALYVARKYAVRNWKAISAATALGAALLYAGFAYQQARDERTEASARFEDARGAAHYLLFTLYDELGDRPHTLRLRRQVAITAQHYLSRLADSRSTVPEVRLEAARGLLRLAQIEASPNLPNVGQPELAKPNLEAALGIVRSLNRAETDNLHAQLELELANNADMFEEDDTSATRHLAQARMVIDRLTSPAPLVVAQFETIRSTVEAWKNDPKNAVDAARTALRVLERDDSLPALLRRSVAAEYEGDGIYMTDKMASIAYYRRSLAFAEKAVQLYPNSYVARRRLEITHYDVGTILMLLTDPVEGLRHLQVASDQSKALMIFEPDDDNLRRSFRIVERARAIALAANGHVGEGMTLMEGLVAETKREWITRPGEYRRMRDYAVFEMGLANLRLKYKRTALACASYGRSQAIFERMAKQGHLSNTDREKQLGGIIKTQSENCR